MKNKTLRIGAGIVGLTLAAGLVACSEEDTTAQGGRTIDNCGMEISIDEKPERIVTLRQATTENLFELGQKDKMVGTSSLRDKVQPKWQEAYDGIPVLSKTVATAEQVLDVNPDFIVATQRGSFVESLTGTREFWAENGVRTFVSNTDCPEDGTTGFENLQKDYEQLGEILGAEEEAKKLIDQAKEAVDKADVNSCKSLAFLFNINDAAPWVDGRYGISNDIAKLTGSTNVFEDLKEARNEVSWEAFAEKDPDYIVVADISGRGLPMDTAQEKIDELKREPATKNMKAVRENKFIVVPGVGLDPSVRSLEPLEIIAKEVSKDD